LARRSGGLGVPDECAAHVSESKERDGNLSHWQAAEITNCKSQISNLRFDICDLQFDIWYLRQFEI
jgi:hypothetical protein